jgi:predicted RNA-binding protein with PUA-like domain
MARNGHLPPRMFPQVPPQARQWLMKSEPADCSIDDFVRASGQTLPWIGVRNYQARNFMRDAMRLGDGVLFYHSSCAEPGVAGLAEVAGTATPDASQFDPASPWFDAKASPDAPRWLQLPVKLRAKTRLLSLREMRRQPRLAGMVMLKPGNRLSITPVAAAEWLAVLDLLAHPES